MKAILGLKLLVCLAWMGLSFLLVFTGSSGDGPVDGATAQGMHVTAELAMLIFATALVELFGIAGTWSLKRWGVYILAGCSMLSFVLGLRTGQGFAIVSLATLLVAGFGIMMHWKDFE